MFNNMDCARGRGGERRRIVRKLGGGAGDGAKSFWKHDKTLIGNVSQNNAPEFSRVSNSLLMTEFRTVSQSSFMFQIISGDLTSIGLTWL